MVRLTDGLAFHRTHRDINLDNLSSAGFGVGQQSDGVAVHHPTVRGYRPAFTSGLLPVLS